MNFAHLHLILNHLPIIGVPAGLVFFVWAWRKNQLAASRFALAFVFAASLSVIPVFFSGEPAEELVEHLPGVSENVIHPHHEAAEISIFLTLLLGAAALAALLFRGVKEQQWARQAVVLLGIFAGLSLAYTGSLGGKIRHTEIRGDAPQAFENHEIFENHDKDD